MQLKSRSLGPALGLNVIKHHAGKDHTFIYADPPYFEKAGTLYMSAFDDGDHVAFATCLADHAEARWLLTCNNVPLVADLYPEFRRHVVELNYSAHRVIKASEIMVFSDDLNIPWAKN